MPYDTNKAPRRHMIEKALFTAFPKPVRPAIPFLIIVSFTYFLSNANLFEVFAPRADCMYHNQVLILLHGISDALIFLAKISVGLVLFRLYGYLKNQGFPFYDYAWRFGGFVFFGGLTHAISILDLFKTYYWLDGILKLITAWFCLLVALSVFKEYPKLKQIKTPQEYKDLANKLNELLKEIKENEKK